MYMRIELIHFKTRESIGFYNFYTYPHQGDMISVGDQFYRVLLRSFGIPEGERNQKAFAIVVEPVDESAYQKSDFNPLRWFD